jgi:hypothetical protein
MSGSTSPAESQLHRRRPPASPPRHRTRPSPPSTNYSDYWEYVREYYQPFDTAPRTGSAEVYLHEMPGGQYTNLKEQAAGMGLLPSLARNRPAPTPRSTSSSATSSRSRPSSKVVGDMTMFLVTRGIRPADVLNLEPGVHPFPESVVDMLAGGLGWPPKAAGPRTSSGWSSAKSAPPKPASTAAKGVVPGAVATPANFDKAPPRTGRQTQARAERGRALQLPDVSPGVPGVTPATNASSETSVPCPPRPSSTDSAAARKSASPSRRERPSSSGWSTSATPTRTAAGW